jgi:hypothetical protein
VRVSGAVPGSVHDLTAARIWGIVRRLAAAGLIVLAHKGYTGAGTRVITPTAAGTSQPRKKAANRAHARLRARASAPTNSSRPGISCANSAAAPGAPGSSPKPSTSFKPAKSPDENRSVSTLSGEPEGHRSRQ